LYALADLVYFLLFYVVGYRKKVVYQNLHNSFPEKTVPEIHRIAQQFYRNLANIIFETLKLGSIAEADLRKRVRYQNWELLQDYINQGTSVIALSSHAANWEWELAASTNIFTAPMDGVYKPLSSPFFEIYMRFLRSRLGAYPVRMKEVLRHLLQHRQEPRILCLLSDQIPPRGEIQYWTTFLNQDTAFYVGADKLAAVFKYPVVFVGAERIKRGYYQFSFQLLAEAGSVTNPEDYKVIEAYARELETWVQRHPADYLWSHRRWKHQRPVHTRPN
jgi:Kdo2-lipid IVA lauroyltransferase/acyltransferase